MSRTNELAARAWLPTTWLLICLGVCVLFALVPMADIDFDGSVDSFLTEGLLVNTALPAAIVPAFFMTGLPSAYLASARSFCSRIVPPPVRL